MAKPTTAQILMRVLWPRLQAGERSFLIEDTQLSYGLTAQQLSKAVRRFNENGNKLKWPGFHFSAKVLDVYRLQIDARIEVDHATLLTGNKPQPVLL